MKTTQFSTVLTEEQKQQYIAFVDNFVAVMCDETNVTYGQARLIVHLAASTLLGAVFHVAPPEDVKDIDPFILKTVQVALDREFAVKVKVVD